MKIIDLTQKKKRKYVLLDTLLSKQQTEFQKESLIIEDSKKIPSDMLIKRSSKPIHFKNNNINLFKLESCQNIIIEDCTINQLELNRCHNIQIERCKIFNTLLIKKCHDLTINYSIISILYLMLCYKNFLKECTIDAIINNNSKANIFEQNHFSMIKSEGKAYIKMFLFLSIGFISILFIIFLLILTNRYYSYTFLELILSISIISLSALVIYIFKDYLRIIRYPADNFR